MKKVLVLVFLFLVGNYSFGQSEKFIAAMQKNIVMIDSAMKKQDMTELANNFTRIADAEKTQWLPYYYAAFCTVMNGFFAEDKSKVDEIADKAEILISKAETIAGKPNSEIHVIRSMIATAHMTVDPQARWQQYGQGASKNLTIAKQLDPTNPRPVYLEGQSKFYTPEAFGGGKAPAKELFERAIVLFDNYKAPSAIDPTWGRGATEYFLSQCN